MSWVWILYIPGVVNNFINKWQICKIKTYMWNAYIYIMTNNYYLIENYGIGRLNDCRPPPPFFSDATYLWLFSIIYSLLTIIYILQNKFSKCVFIINDSMVLISNFHMMTTQSIAPLIEFTCKCFFKTNLDNLNDNWFKNQFCSEPLANDNV
jgi:hypothetical protein